VAVLSSREMKVAEAIAKIGYCNPFLPERLVLERAALGADFRRADEVINLPPGADLEAIFANFTALRERAELLANRMRKALLAGSALSEHEVRVYQDVAVYLLYNRHMSYLDKIATAPELATQNITAWQDFQRDFDSFLRLPGLSLPPQFDAGHCFAVFFQIQRAFNHVFECIVGRSKPIVNLRAAVWESIFTHDMGRYTRAVYKTMGDIPTLITGRSGTGKELVARAIGLSRYIPFDHRTSRFETDSSSLLHAVNLSALSPALIESELFGHRKGAFTGAISDREGWLETAGIHGTVFLDEIGELDHSIQVKLLRVLQSRQFSRVGETRQRQFSGKIVAATNRDLAQEMSVGKFREDLYYRLCADRIHTPTLQEQIADRPDDLTLLTRFMAERVLPDLPEESEALAAESVEWIVNRMGLNYAWPGNIRELEQCVRNVMIRKSYMPARQDFKEVDPAPLKRLAREIAAGQFTLEQLTEHYVSMIYAAEGQHYGRAAKRLDMDWRTLKQKLNQDLVETYSVR
jgi:DNA-binding NtrC family response regulator